MCTDDERNSDESIVAKVLLSLTLKFDYLRVVIEEANDLLVLFHNELMGSLQTHESRMNKS